MRKREWTKGMNPIALRIANNVQAHVEQASLRGIQSMEALSKDQDTLELGLIVMAAGMLVGGCGMLTSVIGTRMVQAIGGKPEDVQMNDEDIDQAAVTIFDAAVEAIVRANERAVIRLTGAPLTEGQRTYVMKPFEQQADQA